jgi:putative toxin-antitoxin system antitoxin component (TIGR02293 family)
VTTGEIAQLATDVFEDAAIAIAWLNQPNMATHNRPPAELISTPEGFEIVKNLLLRIEYGVLA